MSKYIRNAIYIIFSLVIIYLIVLLLFPKLKITFSASSSPCLDKNDYCPITKEITATSDNTYNVTSSSFGANGSDTASDSSAIQKALNKALTSSTPIEVVIPAGTYYISTGLYIYSNTILSLDSKAIIKRTAGSSGYILRSKPDANKPSYNQWENIIIEGGTWDLENISNGFHIVHGHNLIIRNTTVKNGSPNDSHVVNLSATQNVIVSNNTFENHDIAESSTRTPIINEFLHIDPAVDNEGSSVPIDGTPVQNFVAEHNTFDNVLSGIGSHSSARAYNDDGSSNMDTTLNKYQCTKMGSNIKIRNNTFKNIHYDAINILFHRDVEIYGNIAQAASDNTQGAFVYTLNTGANIHNNTATGFSYNVTLMGDHTKYYKSAYDIVLNGKIIYKHDEGEVPSECTATFSSEGLSEATSDELTALGVTTSYFIVRYHANGGEGSMADSKVRWGNKTTPNTFTKNGYHFIGWKVQRERSNLYVITYKNENNEDVGPYYGEESSMAELNATYYLYSSGAKIVKRDMLHQGEILNFIAQWKQIKEIEVSDLPSKTIYSPIDTSIDPTNGKLKITFTDNTTTSVALSEATLSGFQKGVIGNQTITATYSGKTTTFNITVDSKYVLIKYHTNGGTLAAKHDSRFGVKNNYITMNNEDYIEAVAYGTNLPSSGLANYNNSSYINIEKEGYKGKTGAEWNTKTDGTGKSYSQKTVYSSSDFCETSTNICEITLYVNWVPTSIETTITTEDNIIKGISAGTILTDIISQMQTTDEIILYDHSGNIKENNQPLKTGDYITVTSNGTTVNYSISVEGDVNGDGNVDVIDVAKLFQHYRKTKVIPESENYYIIAGDVVKDDIITLTDVAKLFQYVRGRITSLD